jgi:DNA-binding GntR family transcriptional regulator
MSNKLLHFIMIDRRSTAPIPNQIHQSIKFLIMSEKAKFKDVLPTTIELATHLDVEIHDVTEGYHMLVIDRMIRVNENGVAFVEFYEFSETVARQAVPFFDTIKSIGMKPSVELLDQKILVVDAALALESAIPEGETVFYFKRLFLGDNRPFCQIEQYIRLHLLPAFESGFHKEIATYHYYQSIGLKVASISRRLNAVIFSRDVCERMGERRNAAGLRSRQIVRDGSDQVLEYSISYLRSTYFQPFTTYGKDK